MSLRKPNAKAVITYVKDGQPCLQRVTKKTRHHRVDQLPVRNFQIFLNVFRFELFRGFNVGLQSCGAMFRFQASRLRPPYPALETHKCRYHPNSG